VKVQVGAHATVSLTVGQADTAISLGSGNVPVLGTPRVLALMEQAAIRAIENALDETQTTVGVSAELTHSVATPVGRLVHATAQVSAVDGRTIDFSVTVSDPLSRQEVSRGSHRRVVVDYSRFMSRLGSSTRL
jgi:fluoroacetyl-CoA thioesterase